MQNPCKQSNLVLLVDKCRLSAVCVFLSYLYMLIWVLVKFMRRKIACWEILGRQEKVIFHLKNVFRHDDERYVESGKG